MGQVISILHQLYTQLQTLKHFFCIEDWIIVIIIMTILYCFVSIRGLGRRYYIYRVIIHNNYVLILRFLIFYSGILNAKKKLKLYNSVNYVILCDQTAVYYLIRAYYFYFIILLVAFDHFANNIFYLRRIFRK